MVSRQAATRFLAGPNHETDQGATYLESGCGAADLQEEIPDLCLVTRVDGDELQAVRGAIGPANDGGIDGDGRPFHGDLKDEVIFQADIQRHFAEEAAAPDGEVDQGPFAFNFLAEPDWDDKALE
jgi:hypothetical protein